MVIILVINFIYYKIFTLNSSDSNAYLIFIHLNDLGGPILLMETPNLTVPY